MIGNHYEREKECELCHGKSKSTKILAHHLSYDPEIIIYLCYVCHINLHILARYDDVQRKKVINWVEQFGRQWENGTEKYFKSDYFKNYANDWRKNNPERGREANRKWRNKNRDKVNTWKRAWYNKNKDKINAAMRAKRKRTKGLNKNEQT